MIQLRPADIVLVRGRSRLSRWIRLLTRSPGEPRTRVSHVAVAVNSHRIVEALGRGVVLRDMPEGYAHSVYRPMTIPSADRDAIVTRALSYVGRPYGWLKLPLHALDWLLGGRYVFRRLAFVDGWPICSYLLADSYAAGGVTFAVNLGAATPDDIHDRVSSRPDLFQRIYT